MANALELELIEDDYDPETDILGTWVIVPMNVQKAIKNGEDLKNIPFLQKSNEDIRKAIKQLIPPAFQDLMTDPTSPIIDFYPEN
ncbi:hypothetical protein MCAP1_002000 [Malassezia caprae]|uniref:Xrn1 helical domain-containing protein n=1 Tax=Malassezia caprae TaxID=1381934 RepID=A0AAF0IVF5_9BASI|nr:hypothetical protein MCAP1_002000 [Malassezia caprae]